MSIIHDALKKAQQRMRPKITVVKVALNAQTTTSLKKTPLSSWLIIISVLCLILGLVCAHIFKPQPTPKTFVAIQESKPLLSTQTATPDPIMDHPKTEASKLSPSRIHGIMANKNGYLALIDDHIYEEGDTINNSTIIKINLNAVTLNTQGIEQTITLKN